ncbi:cell division ATP-binding protein FtsE [Psychrobium sp. MM17-31]|uniref:cell division ATP-binding protein FtsE n=1 Tax=Psychrobium sp. MM17-31 TaxID=2917758 RepID=UPI001EF600A8|nr:cell division ATP-binding protein FtsE [Psychrobium sp. MM17-31]MCG7532685.1 cell division ATP-binding protein FtsE [Psychrobium sp. MM17-31]
MIRFEDVTKVYPGGQQALNRVNFHLQPGEMAFLTGHSGAGKSTLLKLIAMMERPTSGQVFINGHNLNKITKKQVPYARRDIGMIFQNHRLLMDRSVFNNVALPLIIEGYHLSDIKRRVAAALDKVGLLSKVNNMPSSLSGGELQRVGIARAIVNKPPLLLADEPTGNLDPHLSVEILKVFEDLNSVGVAVMIATHDLGLIARMKYHTFTLRQGQMIQDGLSSSDLRESEFEPVI